MLAYKAPVCQKTIESHALRISRESRTTLCCCTVSTIFCCHCHTALSQFRCIYSAKL